MTNAADRVTRVAADLMDSAVSEGMRHGRSAKQQLEHWARVGREVSSQQTAAGRRVQAAMTGELDVRELNAGEGVVFNAEIAAAIQENSRGRTTEHCRPSAASPLWLLIRAARSSSTARMGHRCH
jgi:hypothetical protein